MRLEVFDPGFQFRHLFRPIGVGLDELLVLLLPNSNLAFELTLVFLFAIPIGALRLSILFSSSLRES